MKQLLFYFFITTSFSSYSQDLSKYATIKHIDSVVSAINHNKNTLLKECDSIANIAGKKIYKCWSYYFNDTNKKIVNKISISFNDLPEELCLYYENNKVIKRDEYKIRKGHYKSFWSIYFKDDKEINYKGIDPERGITYDKIEEAYNFLSEANEYSTKVTSR